MNSATMTSQVNYQWSRVHNTFWLHMWVDGHGIDVPMEIAYLDAGKVATLRELGQTVTPGWWIDDDGYMLDGIDESENTGPLDALMRREFNAKLAALRDPQQATV